MTKLLLDINSFHAKEFINDYLGPLLHLPSPKKTEMLQTLCELLTTNSVSIIARRLNVHRQTIAYRRECLEKLLNTDFEDPLARTDLLVALRLYQIHRPR